MERHRAAPCRIHIYIMYGEKPHETDTVPQPFESCAKLA